MVELYWISRLDAIAVLLEAILIIGGITGIIGLFAYVFGWIDACSDTAIDRLNKIAFKIFKVYAPIMIVAALLRLFIPTSNELLAIYGIGNTIEYIKSNDKAKELPDKVVDALTRYVDSIEWNNKEKIEDKSER